MHLISISLAAHLGIALSATLVTFLLMPFIVPLVFGVRGTPSTWQDRVIGRYQQQRSMPPWIYAWFKLRLDPMFQELPELFRNLPTPLIALDIGCGWGVPGTALLEWFPQLQLFAIEPARGRSRIAGRIFAERGTVVCGLAPAALDDSIPEHLDTVMMLDVLHLMPESAIIQTLQFVHKRLHGGGHLIARVNIPQPAKRSLIWRLDAAHRAFFRAKSFHLALDDITRIIRSAGFHIACTQNSGDSGEMVWLIAQPAPTAQRTDAFTVSSTGHKN